MWFFDQKIALGGIDGLKKKKRLPYSEFEAMQFCKILESTPNQFSIGKRPSFKRYTPKIASVLPSYKEKKNLPFDAK